MIKVEGVTTEQRITKVQFTLHIDNADDLIHYRLNKQAKRKTKDIAEAKWKAEIV